MNDSHRIRVTVAKGRWVLRWIDPLSGREREQVLGKELSDRDRERAILQKEQELESGVMTTNPRRLLWTKFLEEVERSYFPRLAPSTCQNYRSTLNVLAKHVKVTRPVDLTARRIEYFIAQLRNEKASTATIRHHLRQLKAVLRWGKRKGLLQSIPEIEMPKLEAGETVAKGRPLTEEEFAKMVAAVPESIKVESRRASWEFFLRGLWLSGLRLGEAIALSWDDRTTVNVVTVGETPFLHFPASSHKSRREEWIPLTRDFWELLQQVPAVERLGYVFKLGGFGHRKRDLSDISAIVQTIGKASKVVVKEHAISGRTKYATAHDLRRSFGYRWSSRLPISDLRQLCRHRNVSTTLDYYAMSPTSELARKVWKDAA